MSTKTSGDIIHTLKSAGRWAHLLWLAPLVSGGLWLLILGGEQTDGPFWLLVSLGLTAWPSWMAYRCIQAVREEVRGLREHATYSAGYADGYLSALSERIER